ncbi:ROK family protein [Planctomicrobium sp. SH527]|uniref:ROK family protein n=1 Tax=Planctomicrobium sp. SH527 TaxID=3448123 RepID=UPI003F5BDEA9
MSDLFVGIDVGGTTVKFAVARADGIILREGSIATESHLGPELVLKQIGEYAKSISSEVGGVPGAVGVGLPGLVDSRQGIARYLPNLMSHWRDVPVTQILSPLVGCDVRLLNDVRMATYGELIYGLGQDVQTMVFMAIGTGIGGGIVIDGKLRLGPLGAAGELGHQTIDPTGPLCGCGNHGCLETFASATAIASEGIRLMLVGMAPALRDRVGGDPGRVTVQAMGEVADQDPAVRQAILHAASNLAIGIANVVVTIDPELIVIGGGVSRLGDLLLDQVKSEIRTRLGRLFPVEQIRIETSQLDVRAGVMGGIALACRGIPE